MSRGRCPPERTAGYPGEASLRKRPREALTSASLVGIDLAELVREPGAHLLDQALLDLTDALAGDAELLAELPRRPVPAADEPDDGGWGDQYAQRVRRSGLVAGLGIRRMKEKFAADYGADPDFLNDIRFAYRF